MRIVLLITSLVVLPRVEVVRGEEPAGYGGDTVAAVEKITPKIQLRRDSALAPAVVQATVAGSVFEIATKETTPPANAYTDAEYTWDFGDEKGTESFVSPVTGKTVNANRDQTGPEACYVYRQPGEYVITLTMRVWAGEEMHSAKATTTFVAEEWGPRKFGDNLGVFYVDSNAKGANRGTKADPFRTDKGLYGALVGGSRRRILIKRGSEFAIRGAIQFIAGQDDVQVLDYGEGPRPILRFTEKATKVGLSYQADGEGIEFENHVWSNIDFRGGGHPSEALIHVTSKNGGGVADLAFLNCRFAEPKELSKLVLTGVHEDGALTHGLAFWGCEFDGASPVAGEGARQNLTVSGGWDSRRGSGTFLSVVGGAFQGGSRQANARLDHHIYPGGFSHALFRWIDFKVGGRFNYCVNANGSASADRGRIVGRGWCFEGCRFSGTKNGLDASNGSNKPWRGRLSDVVIQGNSFVGLGRHGLGANDLALDAENSLRVISKSYKFVAKDVGRILFVTGGGGWSRGVYRVRGVDDGGAVLETSPATPSPATLPSETLPPETPPEEGSKSSEQNPSSVEQGHWTLDAGGGAALFFFCAQRVVFRDNTYEGIDVGASAHAALIARRLDAKAPSVELLAYRNRFHWPADAGVRGLLQFDASAPDLGDFLVLRDNEILDLRPSVTLVSAPFGLRAPRVSGNRLSIAENAERTCLDTSTATAKTLAEFEAKFGPGAFERVVQPPNGIGPPDNNRPPDGNGPPTGESQKPAAAEIP